MFFSKRVLTDPSFTPKEEERQAYLLSKVLYNHYETNKLWYVDDPNVPHITFDGKYLFGVCPNHVQVKMQPANFKYFVYKKQDAILVRCGFEFKPLVFHPFLSGFSDKLLPGISTRSPTTFMDNSPWIMDMCVMITSNGKYMHLTEKDYPIISKYKSKSMGCCEVIDCLSKKFNVKLSIYKTFDYKISELKIASV